MVMASPRLRVFVSSRMEELRHEREAIRTALAELLVDSFVFELDAGARPIGIEQTYLEEEQHDDLYVGLFWKGYGPHTIAEFEHACRLGMDCLVYEKPADAGGGRDPALQAFLDRIGDAETGLVTIRPFHTADELARAVKTDVAAWQADLARQALARESAIFHGVPSRPPADFVGREAEVARMGRALRQGRDLAIEGPPGMGKTTLAIALAHQGRTRRHFRDGVLWASLGPRPDVAGALMGWAQALEGPGLVAADVARLPQLGDRAQALRDAIGSRCMLLVIDDVWERDAADALRCGGPRCTHLITTRDRQVAGAFAGPEGAEALRALDDDEAHQLLRRLAPEACASDEAGVRGLIRAVGGLPQAVRLIGGYLAQPGTALFGDVFEGLRPRAIQDLADPGARLRLAEQRLGARGAGKTSLEETIRLSLGGLPDEARTAFASLGAFAAKPERFTPEAAAEVSSADGTTLALLAARNLIEVDRASRRLSLHPTIADVARAQLDPASTIRHRDHYLKVVREAAGDPVRIGDLYGQLRWAWQRCPDDEHALMLYGAVEGFQAHRGLYAESLTWAERALAVAEAGGLGPVAARVLGMMGEAERSLGRYDRALAHYREALARWESLDLRGWQMEARLRTALILGDQHRYGEALAEAERANALAEAASDRPKQAEILMASANLLRRQGDQAQALERLERAHGLLREAGDRASEGECLLLLGVLHRDCGHHEKALEYIRASMALQAELGGPEGDAEARLLLATVTRSRGQVEEALAAAREACQKAEASGNRSLFATGLGLVGDTLMELGRVDEALTCYQRQLALHDEVENPAGRAQAFRNIAWARFKGERHREVAAAYEQAAAIYRETGDQAALADSLVDLRYACARLGQSRRAQACLREAAAIWRERGDRGAQANVLGDLGSLLEASGQHERALAAYGEADGLYTSAQSAGRWCPAVPPLAVAFGLGLSRWLGTRALRPTFLEVVSTARQVVLASTGVTPPPILLREDHRGIGVHDYAVYVHDVLDATVTLSEHERFFAGSLEALQACGVAGRATTDPETGAPAAWVARPDWPAVERRGHALGDGLEYIGRHLRSVMRSSSHRLLGHQQTFAMVESCRPAMGAELRREPTALSSLVLLLQNLLEEGVPLLSLPEILDTFSRERSPQTDRLKILAAVRLIPSVRARLPGNVTDGALLRLPEAIEREIELAIRTEDGQAYLTLEPARTQHVLALVREAATARPHTVGVTVRSAAIRRFAWKLVELEFPGLRVISQDELDPARVPAIFDVPSG